MIGCFLLSNKKPFAFFTIIDILLILHLDQHKPHTRNSNRGGSPYPARRPISANSATGFAKKASLSRAALRKLRPFLPQRAVTIAPFAHAIHHGAKAGAEIG